MLNRVAEQKMHVVRWLLAIAWLLLIASLFYDPISRLITEPGSGTLFSQNLAVINDPNLCVKIRDSCISEQPFSMGALVWWAMIVPAGIIIIFVLGHEFWRRICPLSFLSQIPRALGLQRQRNVTDPVTGTIRSELATIKPDSWLGRNHLYVQFGLFILGLWARLLFVNGDRIALGIFLLVTIASAILVGYLFPGKSWCNYFCPMAPVQTVYTGPRSLLGSQAHLEQNPAITQSMCRTVDSNSGQERTACVGCKMPCIDIDAEQAYWTELQKPGRRLVQYGYLGMVIAFYWYFFLYSGNWDYYFSGAWAHEEDLLDKLFDPGFYIAGYSIPIPKLIAPFLLFGALIAIFYAIGRIAEKLIRKFKWNGHSISAEQAQHITFTFFTFASFWTFFSYGARPTINRLPEPVILGFNGLIIAVGVLWVVRTLNRTQIQYQREGMAVSLRKQLQKINVPPALLQGRTLEELSTDEVYAITKGIPAFSHQTQLQAYIGVVQDLLEQKVVDPSDSLNFFNKLRQELELKDSDHFATIQKIAETQPELLIKSALYTAAADATTIAQSKRRSNSTTRSFSLQNAITTVFQKQKPPKTVAFTKKTSNPTIAFSSRPRR